MMELRRYLHWLDGLSLDASTIIIRFTNFGWRAHISEGEFTLYGANADNPTDAVGTLYRSRVITIDAIERDLETHSMDAGL